MEQGAAHRVLAQIHDARNDLQEAEAAHSRSLDVLGAIQSRSELAQSLLAYGRSKRTKDPVEGRRLAETREAAEAAFDHFVDAYGAKYGQRRPA